jgi:hypothetical protein
VAKRSGGTALGHVFADRNGWAIRKRRRRCAALCRRSPKKIAWQSASSARSAMPGDHRLAAGRRHILKCQRTLPSISGPDDSVFSHPPEYHVLLKIVIRPANKKVPHAPKTSNHANSFQSSINVKSNVSKCIN